MRLQLTREDLQVKLSNHYTIQGAREENSSNLLSFVA